MLIPAFQLHLNVPILDGLVVVGHYDGKHPSLTCATSAGKIFIHSPHERNEESSNQLRYLNINRRITALAAGRMNLEKATHSLLVGTQTVLRAYDVEENSDSFYKDVPDGVYAILHGSLPSIDAPLAIVGGNCSIQGFNHEGDELFWTVTGDNVSAMTFCDADGDGKNELLVGSEDYEIRVFSLEEVISETTETDKITGLCPIHLTTFGYSLANGTVGVYNKASRVWRVKSKHKGTRISSFDLDGDGQPELICGWSSGKVEVRSDRNGQVIYKDMFSSPISAICQADYRMDGKEEVICCALDGEVRGYLPAEAELATKMSSMVDRQQENEALNELQKRKTEMLLELKSMEETTKQRKAGNMNQNAGIIPQTTRVNLEIAVNEKNSCNELVLSTNNDTIIKMVAVLCLDGGVFAEGECLVMHPPQPGNSIRVPIACEKNVSSSLIIKVLVGARSSSTQFHIFELKHQLPKFSMFTVSSDRNAIRPTSSVRFRIKENPKRVAQWLQQSFYIEEVRIANDSIRQVFRGLRDSKPMWFRMTSDGTFSIESDNMELAGEMIQDLCHYLQVQELDIMFAEYPHEMASFEQVLLKVDDFNATRLKLTAEMADSSNLVKTLVIKAEDARILGDMKSMRRMYTELFTLNNQLIGEFEIRSKNHQALLDALKEVNHMIQKAAKLRVGNAKGRVVSACRKAIKENNIHSLFQIILSDQS